MSRPIPVALVTSALVCAAASAQSPRTPPFLRVPHHVDSGFVANDTGRPAVVFAQHVRRVGATWVQLELAPTSNLPAGSFLRLTGRLDGAVQRHDARTLADWSHHSAAFNGDDVLLELVAAPGTSGNRVVVDAVYDGLPGSGPGTDSLCGTTDDRALSADPRQGRLWLGCTGWMISDDLMLTAGHCYGSSPNIIEFNVPLSTSSGTVVRAHPDDQYPFTMLQRIANGVGADWGLNRVGRNSTHGLLPTERNGGQWYALGAVPSQVGGNSIRITGYGSTTSPVSNTWDLAQKTHVGALAEIRATSLCYATDTTGGNSGSPIVHEETGAAIGIHTHSGCTATGGCNQGTRIDRGDLQSALAAAGRRVGTFTAFGSGCPGSGLNPPFCTSVNATGGTLEGVTTRNEYAYAATTPVPVQVTGFELFTASATGAPVTVAAALYGDAGGAPATTPLASTTMTIGTAPGFYVAQLAMPVAVPAGPLYVSIDQTAGTTYRANLRSGESGVAYYRRPAFSGGWAVSGAVTVPSVRIRCVGDGQPGALPAAGGGGAAEVGSTYRVELARAVPSAPCSLVTGFSDTAWAGGALPFDLAGLGAAGCALRVAPTITMSAATDASGAADGPIPVLRDPALVGLDVFHQWLVLDAGANGLGLAVSDGIRVRIGG